MQLKLNPYPSTVLERAALLKAIHGILKPLIESTSGAHEDRVEFGGHRGRLDKPTVVA